MEQTSGKFEYITQLPEISPSHDNIADNKTSQDLKVIYNKLLSLNQHKQDKLYKLARLIEDYRQQSARESTIDEKLEIISNLQEKAETQENLGKNERFEQEILINKKENLKTTTALIRGKLIELQKNFDRITTNYKHFSNSNFLSKYTLLLSNNSLEEFKQFFDDSKSIFQNNIHKLEKKLQLTNPDHNISHLMNKIA